MAFVFFQEAACSTNAPAGPTRARKSSQFLFCAAASVGIAQAATPKKPIPISPGMERCLKKLVLEAEVTGFQDPEKGG